MIGYIISGVVSIIAGVLVFLLKNAIQENRRLKKEKNDAEEASRKALRNGVKCLLRSKLMELHDIYMGAKLITPTEYENWTRMYASYKDLGGNGMVTHMAEDIEKRKMDT